MKKGIPQSEYTLIYTLAALLLPYAWSAYLSTLLGIYTPPIVYGGALSGTVLLLWWGRAWRAPLTRRQWQSITLALIVGLYVATFMHPSTVFSGRDQGAIATAAALLAEHGTPYIASPAISAFYEIYGPGQALNYPGFHYSQTGTLITQFPLPYIAFVAGTPLANGILIAVFLILFGALVRSVTRSADIEYLGYALLLSAFPLLWFARFTLSENLALVLLPLTLSLYLMLTDRTHSIRPATYTLFGLSLCLLLFARIEGVWFFVAFSILVVAHRSLRSWIRANPLPRIIVPATILASTGALVLLISWPFYKTIGALLLEPSTRTDDSAPDLDTTAHANDLLSFFYPAFHAYGITLMIAIVLLATLTLIWRRQLSHTPALPIILITLPLCAYILTPHISADHPWMLRRYVFWLVPLSAAAALYLVHRAASRGRTTHILARVAVIIIICYQMSISAPYLLLRESVDRTHVTQEIAANFTTRDLLLVSPHATQDGWAMLPGPLMAYLDRHAVYFFNPDDLARLDTRAFERVFLIVSDTERAHFQSLIGDRTPHPLRDFHQSDKETPHITELYGYRLKIEHDHFTALPKPIHTQTPISAYQLR